MRAGPHRAFRRYAGFLGQALGITAGLAALGYLPTWKLGGPEAVPAMFAGCALSALASALGGLPILFSARRSPGPAAGRTPRIILASMALRLIAVLAASLALALTGRLPVVPLLVWVAVSYAALLVADTRYALSAVASPAEGDAPRPAGSGG